MGQVSESETNNDDLMATFKKWQEITQNKCTSRLVLTAVSVAPRYDEIPSHLD